ncbi:MAG: GTPase HflX [Bacteroidota bacterium]
MQPKTTRESAILVGVQTPETTRYHLDESLDELELLADTAGADVTDRLTQNMTTPAVATYIGKGKVQELKALVEKRKADLVIFDDDLSPVQARNLERELECKLVDRSGLILDIFAGRAKTATAKTQVELAQLDYLVTRLTRQWTHLSRQKGGIGMRGPGETQIETDRRLIGRRIAVLKDKLDRIDRQRTTQRKGRADQTRVALVGYTNAGKSTLMNALAEDAQVHAEDRLFATLDATTRKAFLAPNKPVLLSDTVGFIRKLPHKLIESFKSTLDETREADVLMHVVDASHPYFEDHIRVVNQTLKDLGALDKPTLMVFNKLDVLEERGLLASLRASYENAAFVSALRGIGLDQLRVQLLDVIEADYRDQAVVLPVSAGKERSHLHRVAEVHAEVPVTALSKDAADDSTALPALVIRYRVAPKNADDLDRMLTRFADLRVVSTLGPDALLSGDGQATAIPDALVSDSVRPA